MAANQLIDVEAAAAILGVTPRRVRQFIAAGRLSAQRFGPVHVLDRTDVARFARQERPTGRPRVKSA
jgi:excisionase family DNA binding protein